MNCKHCHDGFLENKFGQDVECVNGVLIDIDVAHEGWQRDVNYPVAPCHPMWERQQSGDEDFPNDCQERLNAWRCPNPTGHRPMTQIPEDIMKAARSIVAGDNVYLPTEDTAQIIARALLAERESATLKERERCAEVAQTGDWYGQFQTAGDERRAKKIAEIIRKGTPT